MSIYNITPTVIKDLVQECPNGYHRKLRTLSKEFFEHITATGKGKTLAEKLFNYCFPEVYVCQHCGSDKVKFLEFTTGYRKYCSHLCQCRSDNNRSGYKELISDKVRMAIRTAKSKQTNMERIGVEQWNQTEEGKRKASASAKKFYHAKFPREISGRTWKQYFHAVRHLTNKVYNEHIDQIDPGRLRSKDVVVDHIFSVRDGFDNNVPLDVICHWTNFQMLAKKDNSSKNYRSDKTLSDLYEDYHSS